MEKETNNGIDQDDYSADDVKSKANEERIG